MLSAKWRIFHLGLIVLIITEPIGTKPVPEQYCPISNKEFRIQGTWWFLGKRTFDWMFLNCSRFFQTTMGQYTFGCNTEYKCLKIPGLLQFQIGHVALVVITGTTKQQPTVGHQDDSPSNSHQGDMPNVVPLTMPYSSMHMEVWHWLLRQEGPWIGNCIRYFFWDVLAHPCSDFTSEVRTEMNDYIP